MSVIPRKMVCPHKVRRDSKSARRTRNTTRSKFTTRGIFSTAGVLWVCFALDFEGHTEIFGRRPFTWKTPTPPEDIETQKLEFLLPFLA